jgi:hypothetical protein
VTTSLCRLIRLLSFLAVHALLASCGGGGGDPPPKVVGATIAQNGDLRSGLPLRFESLSHPRLAELAGRENLVSVAAGARDEFDAILRLKEWTAKQFPHSTPNPYPPWDAIQILDWIRGGITGGYCAQYAQVFLQGLASLGYQSRYVEIGLNDNPYAHYVMEVWSNQFNKWVVMDVDYNMHFERDGVPLSALEVHQALVRSELVDVVAVSGGSRDGHASPEEWPLKLAELYFYLRIHLKANHLSAPEEPAFDRFNDMVEYVNSRTVPWELSEVDSPYAKVPLTRSRSGDPAEFDAKLNQTRVSIQAVEHPRVSLTLDNNSVEFAHYEFRVVGGGWAQTKEKSLVWEPHAASPRLEVRAVNSRGVAGPSSLIEARFE